MTPTPTTLSGHRILVGLTAGVLLLGGCTSGNSNAEPTLPPGSPTTSTDSPDPTPTATPTATPSTPPTTQDTAPPTDDQLVELVNAYRNITLDLPPMPADQAQQHIDQAAAELTTTDGTARQRLDDTVGDSGQIIRGRPYTATLGSPQPDGPGWTATVCIATRGETTDIDTGEPTAQSDPFVSEYNEADVRVAPDGDGGWLMADFDQPEDPQDLVRCAPPDIADAVRANWEQTHDLFTEWTAAGQPADRLEPLRPLLTRDFYESLSKVVGSMTITQDSEIETDYGFEVISVRPGEDVIARWCQDATRDPTARATDNETGEVTDLSQQAPAIVTATWFHSEEGWRRGPSTGSRVAQGGEAPCE